MTVHVFYHDMKATRDIEMDGQPFHLAVRSEERVTAEVFEQHYDHVDTDPGADLDNVFSRWNAGSGRESEAFARRECEDCDKSFVGRTPDGIDLGARQHDADKHESNTAQAGDPHTVERSKRSLSVGDVVLVDGEAYLCAPFGWERQEHIEHDAAQRVEQ